MGDAVVLCVATDGYLEKWSFCIASQQRYCLAHHYQYCLLTEPIDGLNGKWSKLAYARRQLMEGQHVLLIDADAEITPQCPPFTECLSAAGKDIFAVAGISGRPNSGVMMLRAGPGSEAAAFLSRCLELRDAPVPKIDFVTRDGENGHVIWVLKQSPYRQHFQWLELAWNCSQPAFAQSAYVRHYTNLLRPLAAKSGKDMYLPRDTAQLTPMARSLASCGLLAVGEIYSVAELARINTVVSPLFAARSAQARAYVRPDDMVAEGILDTVLSRRMRDLIFNLLPDPVLYHFHAYEIAGGSDTPHIFGDTLGGWHRDQDSELYSGSPTHISIFVYLGDVGADDGPFEFCPEPPQAGLRSDSPVISMTGHAGASFVWQRGFYHRAAPNRSPRRRRLLKLSLQPNAFRSAHLRADYFRNAIRALPAGDPELDLLFGRYQGKQAPQIEPRRALQFSARTPQRTLGIADEVLRKARLREKNTPDKAAAYD